ncbi:MAG: alcohol dehydrogenase catalytic domain-containing protein [Thermoplasmatales archaeon]|nr:alcohol dehydrogenase catalytic domain-containing protein [Thermoplasmatales archaeon]
MRGFGFEEHGGPDRLKYVEVPEPTPGPGEVRIGVRGAGLNHLDLFTLAGIPGVPIVRPHVLGSDASGIVDSLGSGVENVRVGDRVLVNPGFSDGTCEQCLRGQDSLCRNYRILGEHTQGSVAPFVVVPARGSGSRSSAREEELQRPRSRSRSSEARPSRSYRGPRRRPSALAH